MVDGIQELVEVLQPNTYEPSKTYSAEISKIDNEGTVWVYLEGSNKETPTATTSAEVNVGDSVNVEWRNNKLYIAGNVTNPSAGSMRVNVVEQAAQVANQAAQNAVADAGIARSAAEQAQATANAVEGIATRAEGYATEAKASAFNASEYASRALGNLSSVQSVAETLAWITRHGTMTKTGDYVASSDTEVVEGKKYYTRSGSGTSADPYVYTLVASPTGNPSTSGYYEGQLNPSHVYFVVDANGDYIVGGTHYSVVPEPDVADISTYYELSIDESLNNYVATHLAVDSEGLWIIPDAGGNKVLIATGQGTGYPSAGTYIISGSNVLAKFTADGIILGKDDGTQAYAKFDYHSLQLIDKEGNDYVHFSDLRNEQGVFETEDSFVGDGSQRNFNLTFTAVDTNYIVKVNDVVIESGIVKATLYISFTSAPQEGDIILVEYTTASQFAKAFTLGMRESGSEIGTLSVTEGYRIIASGNQSHAEGFMTTASGNQSHAEGRKVTASGKYAHAEGEETISSGEASHAEGYKTIASEYVSHAEGVLTTASGPHAHAEGSHTTASGPHAHAEGFGTTASGQCSHAEGMNTIASDYQSHAEGFGTTASGRQSHAQNSHTEAGYTAQTAIGKYNENQSKNAFEIGNGTADNARSNALAVTWDGNVEMALDTTATSGTDKEIYDALVSLGWDSDVIV